MLRGRAAYRAEDAQRVADRHIVSSSAVSTSKRKTMSAIAGVTLSLPGRMRAANSSAFVVKAHLCQSRLWRSQLRSTQKCGFSKVTNAHPQHICRRRGVPGAEGRAKPPGWRQLNRSGACCRSSTLTRATPAWRMPSASAATVETSIAAGGERSAIDDGYDRAAASIEIVDSHLRSKRQRAMCGDQAAVIGTVIVGR